MRPWPLRQHNHTPSLYTEAECAIIHEKAAALGSDGCSWVPDFYLTGCLAHDIAYRTHLRFDDRPITRAEADRELRQYIQSKSPFGVFSPMSWWRWAFVRGLGSEAWEGE